MELISRADLVDLIHDSSKTLDHGIENVFQMDADFEEGYPYWTMTSSDGVRIMVHKTYSRYTAELS